MSFRVNKITRDISASAFQVILTQFLSLAILKGKVSLNPPARLFTGIFAYLFLVAATGLIRINDFKMPKTVASRFMIMLFYKKWITGLV